MSNFEDDLPFESNNYQDSNIRKFSNIQKLRIEEFRTDFTQMEELVEHLDNELYIPVYGDWDKVDNNFVQKIAKNIKEHFQNGLIREIEIAIDNNGHPNLKIKGFGEYENTIDLKNNDRIIHFKIRNE